VLLAQGCSFCDFSFKRYQKDKREMNKQITKAKKLLENPFQNSIVLESRALE